LELGAKSVLCEDMPEEKVEGVTYIQVASTEDAVGKVATLFYGDPSRKLKLVGVTGTNGKTTIATLLYNMLRKRPSNSTGTRIARMMMTLPIEGTPIFLTPNGSMLASRCVSVICLLLRYLMNFSPNHAEITSERIRASSERNEMYPHMWAPLMPYCSRKRKR
jgi:hypothetical protein